jgi:hypothetical protein
MDAGPAKGGFGTLLDCCGAIIVSQVTHPSTLARQ